MWRNSVKKRDLNESVRSLLKDYRISPSKKLGQHFLIDEKVYAVIRSSSQLEAGDNVLEIGCGIGILTEQIIADILPNGHLIAVEKDKQFAGLLSDRFGSQVDIRYEDARYLEPETLFHDGASFKFVGNLPYNAGTYILRNLLQNQYRPKQTVVILQKEVVDRITANPGNMSVLSVSVQLFGQPSMELVVPRDSFYPKPAVTSAILKICSFDKPLIPDLDREHFFKVVKAGFSNKRKMLRNTLANGLKIDSNVSSDILCSAELVQTMRPEEVSVNEWIRLYEVLRKDYHELFKP